MKISETKFDSGEYRIRCAPGEYDGYPAVSTFVCDHPPCSSNSERFAVASLLLFGEKCGGELVLPTKCGPATVQAMSRSHLVEGINLQVPTIEYYPKPLPVGSKAISVSDISSSLGEPNTLTVLRSDRFSGSIRTHDSLTLSTNSFLFAHHSLALVATAVLFAEDLGASTVSIPRDSLNGIEESNLESVRDLLAATRLELDVLC